MKIWAGLGNPGDKYAGNRHNIGFMVLDRVASDHGFTPWKKAFQGLVAEGRLGGERVILLKPSTFMNLSGQAVGEAMRFHKLGVEDLTVFHDELDIAPAKVRLKQGGGHAGHNGLRSIHQHVGEAYARVRLGIGHPGHKDAVASYVLHDFAKVDQDWLDDLQRGISDGAADLARGDGAKFLNAVNARLVPQRPNNDPDTREARSQKKAAAVQPAATPAPTPAPVAAPEAEKSPLQRLAERFR